MKNTHDHHGAKGGLRRLRRPRLLTYVAVVAIVGAIPVATAAASGKPSLAAPAGLQNFNLRLGDARATAGVERAPFSRTPSFAWTPVRGATRYEFQLSTSKNFAADNGVVWSTNTLTVPAAAVPISLPWITGPSLYWHVRAWGNAGAVSRWSEPQSFEMSWTDTPRPLPSEPGYVRWTPVPGATGYDVWFTNLGTSDGASVGKIFRTITTVADEREYYTGHQAPQVVEWRVRARRQLYGATSNGLPRASYGPWSAIYSSPAGTSSSNSSIATPLKTVAAQAVSGNGSALMPAFVFSGDGFKFHRVYIATDESCTNIVHVGSIVSGDAYAPRVTGPLALETMTYDDTSSFLIDGSEGKTFRSDGEAVTSSEAAPTAKSGSAGATSGATSDAPAPVDLWDSNWASGHYYWTVVPVEQREVKDANDSANSSNPSPNGQPKQKKYEYHDLMLPQDACQAGRVQTFKKGSAAPTLGGRAPYATGLSPSGRLLSATHPGTAFYGVPLVAWTPSSGATGYDLEWSRTAYPWREAGSLQTPATSALLRLKPGTWFYRVRGIDPWLPVNHMLSWSSPMRIHIARPTFSVHGG